MVNTKILCMLVTTKRKTMKKLFLIWMDLNLKKIISKSKKENKSNKIWENLFGTLQNIKKNILTKTMIIIINLIWKQKILLLFLWKKNAMEKSLQSSLKSSNLKYEWVFLLSDKKYFLLLEHDVFSGKRIIKLNGKILH